jgi:hypothetical protein
MAGTGALHRCPKVCGAVIREVARIEPHDNGYSARYQDLSGFVSGAEAAVPKDVITDRSRGKPGNDTPDPDTAGHDTDQGLLRALIEN